MSKKLYVLLLVLVLNSGCGNGSTGSPLYAPTGSPSGVPAELVLTTSAVITSINNTVSLEARILDGNGKGVGNVVVTFASTGVGALASSSATTNSEGYASTTIYSGAAGSAAITASTSAYSASTDVYFVSGKIQNKMDVAVDADGNGVFNEPSDLSIAGTSGQQVEIKVVYTDAAGNPLIGRNIKISSSSSLVTFTSTALQTDNTGAAYTYATLSQAPNTEYINIAAYAEDGTGSAGSISIQIHSHLSIIPTSPSVAHGNTIGIMILGGAAPYTVTSLTPSLTSPSSWTVSASGGTFYVTGVSAGTATLVITDSAGTTLQVSLLIS